MERFTAKILKIGNNPYVGLPEDVLNTLFEQADKNKGPIFLLLTPSREKEILRYLNFVKTEESLVRNIEKVAQYLSGETPKGLSTLIRSGA